MRTFQAKFPSRAAGAAVKYMYVSGAGSGFVAQGRDNEPNWAVEIAGLKRDVEHVLSELQKLRGHVDKLNEKREQTVDKQLLAFEARVSEKFEHVEKKFVNYATLDSFRPVTKWLTIIGASLITFLLTVITAVINFFLTFWQATGGGGK